MSPALLVHGLPPLPLWFASRARTFGGFEVSHGTEGAYSVRLAIKRLDGKDHAVLRFELMRGPYSVPRGQWIESPLLAEEIALNALAQGSHPGDADQ